MLRVGTGTEIGDDTSVFQTGVVCDSYGWQAEPRRNSISFKCGEPLKRKSVYIQSLEQINGHFAINEVEIRALKYDSEYSTLLR